MPSAWRVPKAFQLGIQQTYAGDLRLTIVQLPHYKAILQSTDTAFMQVLVFTQYDYISTLTYCCRVLSRADFAGLGEEEGLSLKLLIQAQALLAASRAPSAAQMSGQSAAQHQWQAFASLQACTPEAATEGQSRTALQQQQRTQMLHERLQSASSAVGIQSVLHFC